MITLKDLKRIRATLGEPPAPPKIFTAKETNLSDMIGAEPRNTPPGTFLGIPVETDERIPRDVAVVKQGGKVVSVIALTEEAQDSAKGYSAILAMLTPTD